jgi:hypothetical protein
MRGTNRRVLLTSFGRVEVAFAADNVERGFVRQSAV